MPKDAVSCINRRLLVAGKCIVVPDVSLSGAPPKPLPSQMEHAIIRNSNSMPKSLVNFAIVPRFQLCVKKAAFMNDATPEQLEVVMPRLVPCPITTTVVMKAHQSLFRWSQWALPVHDAAHDAFMTLPPHTTSSREDDVRPVVEGARTERKSR